MLGQILRKRLAVRGFIVSQDFFQLYPAFEADMAVWIASGKMHACEALIDGLAAAPKAFTAMLRGENFGKTVICLGPTG